MSLPTRLQPEPARPPALSTANCWANDRHLWRKSGRSKRRGNALDSAEVQPAPAERTAKGNRARGLLTNRLLRNSSYSQLGLEVRESQEGLAIPITQADLIERESKESKYPVGQKRKQP